MYKKELTKIQKFLENAKNILENHTHNDMHTNYIAVNVKRYNDYVDIDDLIDNMSISDSKKAFLKEEFTENNINGIYYNWIEYERDYFCREVMGGCRNSKPEYWDKEIEIVENGKKTCYPYIEKLKTKESKIKRLREWQSKDKKELYYLSLLNNKLEGFFGRSGGWLGIIESKELQEIIDCIESNIDYFKNCTTRKDLKYYIDDCLYYVDDCLWNDRIKAINWIIQEIESFNKGLNFKDEIKFRIDEALEDEPFIEDVSLVHYAIN